ncbi:MAG: DUF3098 domain-containing protein, partial [Cytophagales bacterium]
KLPFGKKNYQLMVAGIVVLLLGFIIMSMDKQTYGFGFLGLTLGPIIVLIGFTIEILAILHTPEQPKENK